MNTFSATIGGGSGGGSSRSTSCPARSCAAGSSISTTCSPTSLSDAVTTAPSVCAAGTMSRFTSLASIRRSASRSPVGDSTTIASSARTRVLSSRTSARSSALSRTDGSPSIAARASGVTCLESSPCCTTRRPRLRSTGTATGSGKRRRSKNLGILSNFTFPASARAFISAMTRSVVGCTVNLVRTINFPVRRLKNFQLPVKDPVLTSAIASTTRGTKELL